MKAAIPTGGELVAGRVRKQGRILAVIRGHRLIYTGSDTWEPLHNLRGHQESLGNKQNILSVTKHYIYTQVVCVWTGDVTIP